MLTKMKRTACLVLAAAACLTSVTAFAADWRIKDYDTTNAMAGAKPVVPIVYQEFDENGLPTGRVVSGASAQAEGLKGFANATLANAWVSDVYPNKEYINLYADGVYTGKVFETGRDGKDLVQYNDVDFMWEVAAPHKIYSITKAKLNIGGKVQWFGTIEKNYPVQYTGRNAEVVAERIDYGFAGYDVLSAGAVAMVPEKIEANYKDGRAYTEMVGLTKAEINPKKVNREDVNTYKDKAEVIDVTGREIFIPRTYDIKLTGPAFTAEGAQIRNGVTIFGSTYANPADMNIPDIIGVCTDSLTGAIKGAEITWTAAGFEKAAPYKLYEYLTVDGVVMDGSLICKDIYGNKYYKPAIFRYTGATANLKFRTVVAEVDAKGEVILDRQVCYDNKTYESVGVYVKTGIYPNAEYEVRTGNGEKTLTPVYKFYYNGEYYSTYEVNGEWFTEMWGYFPYSANAPEAWIAPYVE